MSRQYDAKNKVLKIYRQENSDAVDLFLAICNVSREDFEYEESTTVEDYLWGETQPAQDRAGVERLNREWWEINGGNDEQ